MGTASPQNDLRNAINNSADLTQFAMGLAVIPRSNLVRSDGMTPESVADHTVHLGLLACALAQHVNKTFRMSLDIGEIAQLVLVHDLPETRSGDTDTLRLLTAHEKLTKERSEREATAWLRRHFYARLPWVSDVLTTYQYMISDEAKFVWAVDKIAVKFVHLANGPGYIKMPGAELRVRFDKQNIQINTELHGMFPAAIDFLAAMHRDVCEQIIQQQAAWERTGARANDI